MAAHALETREQPQSSQVHTTEGVSVRQDRFPGVSDNKRRHRKHRYRKQGYHKTERENARRVEARSFLSGITLDSHLQSPFEAQQDQDPAIFQTASGTTQLVEEGLMGSSSDPVPEHQLHEMDLFEFYSHHSPLKLALFRSQEHGFELSQHNTASSASSVSRSASVYESTLTPTYEQRRAGLQHVRQTKSLGGPLGSGEVHYCASFNKGPLYVDNR